MKAIRIAILSLLLAVSSAVAFSPSNSFADLTILIARYIANTTVFPNAVASTTVNLVTNSASAADSNVLCISGAGACGTTRGAYVSLGGSQDGNGGRAALHTGNGAGDAIIAVDGSGAIKLGTNGNATRWTVNSVGQFVQDGTNGGDLIISKAGKGLAFAVNSAISAAGSTKTDCTTLAKVINQVTTVTAGQGVCLYGPDSTGDFEWVANRGASDLKVYPNSGGDINGAAADAPITLTAAGKQIALCLYMGSSHWYCTTSAGST